MFNLQGKVALVTGAQRGMGKADALALAQQGAKVGLSDLSKENCQKVADEINSNGGEAIALRIDVSKKDEVESGVAQIVKEFGGLDILVNNAGVYIQKPALEILEEEWDALLAINLKGQFLCAQAAAREMAKKKWGRIINIASIASGGVGIGFAGSVHYAASKGGVIGMSETLAAEWAELGITVNVVAPGIIDTPMIRDPQTKFGEAMLKEIVARVPLKRMGKPEEIAAMAVFLASEESSYVTGATFYVDGGWLAA
ncbi:MAG: hypothetical protein A2748_02210 [Candidatus Wildermuthbacteria bacterium RIFCSPHIGHO2_01_FULL_45_20]|uniref:Short-chain dehydrogenase n=1 Tax=Candidatus Wildermuthbacteria bacterium RIFCSPHIGHO2_02_FULL_45_25 TaxID=1802450 RepID=A0A1G2QYY1_9BACT|nr:MAG: hypothetical protein A2748_02210 [Candidatus Wildermuthbacteria bacterium RIFCSPHIGHO2_01_FULL_45_20]OHA65733.1 MAG: hypothetical protein A3C04_02350 [Candidatus Wildermuthbacteria bacterium RIFCSPHIGHO2_02_FULL_45_25]